jgi:RHS repeat-associated protein
VSKVGFRQEFVLRDHLGNARVHFSDLNGDGALQPFACNPAIPCVPLGNGGGYTEMLQVQHYYPFGMEFDGPWEMPLDPDEINHYTYNGKELNRDFGLEWLDYGARWYMPEIGRWNAVDPLAELDHNVLQTPYHYVANNPIINVDPDGMDWFRNSDGEEYWADRTEAEEGEEHLGEYHIVEGKYGYVVHHQNEVIATVSKSTGDYEEAYTRQVQHMTTTEELGVYNPRATEALLATGDLIQDAILTYAPIPKAARPARSFSPTFKGISTVDDIIAQATKGAPTKGRATIYHRGGGYSQTLSDFYALKPTNIRKIQDPRGSIITGKLSDGRTITARSFSSTKRGAKSTPTLEIRSSTSSRVKEIRY